MKPDTEWIVMTVLYAITMLVAFAGNGFLIYIVWKKPEVRSLTSFMFVNMAIADLLVTLVVMPWSISTIYTDGLWMIPGVFGKVMCKGVVYTIYVNLSASILCLTFMAIDRYYAIVHPLRRHLWFRKPKLTGPFIWIGSLVSMSVFLVIYWRTTIIRLFISWAIQMGVFEGYTSSCSSSTISSPWPLFLFCIFHFMEFMVPCCT